MYAGPVYAWQVLCSWAVFSLHFLSFSLQPHSEHYSAKPRGSVQAPGKAGGRRDPGGMCSALPETGQKPTPQDMRLCNPGAWEAEVGGSSRLTMAFTKILYQGWLAQ